MAKFLFTKDSCIIMDSIIDVSLKYAGIKSLHKANRIINTFVTADSEGDNKIVELDNDTIGVIHECINDAFLTSGISIYGSVATIMNILLTPMPEVLTDVDKSVEPISDDNTN